MHIINPVTNVAFTVVDAERLLGLADQFMEDWEQNEGRGDSDCIERRKEYDAIRPLLAAAPELLVSITKVTVCLSNWMDIADDADKRAYDYEARDGAIRLLCALAGGMDLDMPVPQADTSAALVDAAVAVGREYAESNEVSGDAIQTLHDAIDDARQAEPMAALLAAAVVADQDHEQYGTVSIATMQSLRTILDQITGEKRD